MRKRAMAVLVIILSALSLAAQEEPLEAVRERELTRTKNERAGELHALAGCTPIPLTPPATVTGQLSSASCLDTVIDSYEDIYNLQGTAGQSVTIEYYSTAYEVFLYMEGVTVETVSFRSTSGISKRRIRYTFQQTRTYKLEAEALYSPGDSEPHTGPYTLTVTINNASTCQANDTTMCLQDRFAVSATYKTGSTQGNAKAVALTSDSGYLTFFSATNIEVVVKLLNGCTINSRFWVYAAGLTDLNVVLTVRDTKTGTVKQYTNPGGGAFQPIQDINALATCP